MGNSLLKADKKEAKGEIDQIAIDYRLKLIAFQDELFQSRKKLQDSDRKMADLQKKLDEYVRNKENQIAEVMFTAHMNAQRIEAQTRSQTEYIILEMEEEMRRKEKELELLKKKTNRFMDDNLSDLEGEDIGDRLQIVQDNIRTFREQIETTEISDKPLQSDKPSKAANISGSKPDQERIAPARTEERLAEKTVETRKTEKSVRPAAKITSDSPDNIKPARTIKVRETDEQIQDLQTRMEEKIPEMQALPGEVEQLVQRPTADQKQVAQSEQEEKVLELQGEASQAEQPVQSVTPKKRRVVTKKPGKPKIKKDQADPAAVDVPIEVKDQTAELQVIDEVTEIQEQQEPAANVNDRDFETGWDSIQAAGQVEPNERMRLDAFVDTRYYQIFNGQKEMQHHALQVTIEVEVPPDNYSVRYTKVSSDVVSTLLQYDNVVLNDIFPFNIIEPNPQNIALYFFNCLDDMLSLIDLVLHSLVILELPDLQIQVNSRNTKLDNFLHQGVDELNSIRDSLKPCVEAEPDSVSAFKGTIGRILKKR